MNRDLSHTDARQCDREIPLSQDESGSNPDHLSEDSYHPGGEEERMEMQDPKPQETPERSGQGIQVFNGSQFMGNISDGCRPPDAQPLITGMFCNKNTQAGAGAYSSDSWCQSPQHEITKVKRFAKSRHSSRPKGGEMGVYYKHLLAATKAGFSIEQAKKVVDKPKSAITTPRRVSSEWETSTPQVFRCAQIPAAVGRAPRERSQDRRAMLPPIEPSPRGRVREEPAELSIERGNRSQFQDEVSLDASNREFGDTLEALNPNVGERNPEGSRIMTPPGRFKNQK